MKLPFKYEEWEDNGWGCEGIRSADGEELIGMGPGYEGYILPSLKGYKMIAKILNEYFTAHPKEFEKFKKTGRRD